MRKTISLVLALGSALAMASVAQAATITVGPGAGYDFDTIQAAIDAAVAGDTVLVAPGEYVITEPITFRGKAITVKSEAGPDETTIRMGTPADTDRGSVVIFENNETETSTLEGFTITGGAGSWVSAVSAYAGGGIYYNASSGTLRNCVVVKNKADVGGGGGVSACFGATPMLTNCIFMANSATWGGGVHCWNGCSVVLTECTIGENSANESGGGVFCQQNSSTTMTDCIVAENSAGRGGGGVFCGENSSSVTLTHCIIVGNTAGLGGGGLEIWRQASAALINCVIAQNTTSFGGGIICAPYGYQGCSVTVTNSIIWGNEGSNGREIRVENPATFTISYSNVAGGQTGVSVESGATLNWGTGNIDADPLFARLGYWDDRGTREPSDDVWVEDDFHLQSEAGRWDLNSQTWVQDDVTSPCIDAGDPNSDWKAELWPHGMRINMGAYGGTLQASRSLSDAGNIADLNRDGIVDSADMCIVVDNWHTENTLCDIAPGPLGDGFVDVQDLIVLAEHLFEVYRSAETVEVDGDNDGGQIELELGKLLVVTLESNPSTGYQWELIESNESILKQFGQSGYKPAETSEQPMVGAGGWEVFRFKAMRAGQMTLQLVYRRPWENVEPLKTFSIQVVVP